MKKLVESALALVLAGGALVAGSSAAWALPCASGERITGKTDTAWKCTNISSGVTRLVPFA